MFAYTQYVSDYKCFFAYKSFKADEPLDDLPGNFNYIIFLLEGELRADFDEFKNRHYKAGDILYLKKNKVERIIEYSDCSFLVCVFEVPHDICNRMDFYAYASICDKIEYSMQPIRMRPQMESFVESLVYYLKCGINYDYFYELKQREMFLLFRWFYSIEELAELFYPMLGNSLDFKTIVLGHYPKVRSVKELAALFHMGRSKFDTLFKSEFGMPPGQWLLKQKARHIRHDMGNPEVTISDIILKYDFNSPTHFTRFCKQQFGCTPRELMAQVRMME